jgi:hypothetical protein
VIRAATPQLPVEHAAEDLHARGAIERAPRDAAPGRLDRQVPGLGAREQGDDLQQRGPGEHGQRRAGQRGRELVSPTGQADDQRDRRDERADDRDRRPVAAREAPHADEQSRHPASGRRRRR